MKLGIRADGFKKYLSSLDKLLEQAVKLDADFESRVEFPIEIYALGGFSMLYYGLRYGGTEDIDSANEIKAPVKELIKKVAEEEGLPHDWLNDVPARNLFYNKNQYAWIKADWNFKYISLYVIEMLDLLKNKMAVADKVLMQSTDRNNEKDFDDVEGIIDKMGCDYKDIDELVSWFKEHEIDLLEYPNVYDKFVERISDDGLYWPDGHI